MHSDLKSRIALLHRTFCFFFFIIDCFELCNNCQFQRLIMKKKYIGFVDRMLDQYVLKIMNLKIIRSPFNICEI